MKPNEYKVGQIVGWRQPVAKINEYFFVVGVNKEDFHCFWISATKNNPKGETKNQMFDDDDFIITEIFCEE